MTKYDDAWVAREETKRAYVAEHGLYSPEDEHSSAAEFERTPLLMQFEDRLRRGESDVRTVIVGVG